MTASVRRVLFRLWYSGPNSTLEALAHSLCGRGGGEQESRDGGEDVQEGQRERGRFVVLTSSRLRGRRRFVGKLLAAERGLSNFERLKHGGLSWKLSSGVGRPDVLVAGSNTLGRTCACQKRLQIHGVRLPVCESAESRSARNAHLPAAALDDHDNPALQPSLPSRLQQATGKHSRNAD